MDRQKALLGVLSGVIVLAALVFVYKHMNKDEASPTETKTMTEKKEAPRPIPNTIEGVTAEIESQAALDESSFSEEAAAEEAEIKADSETLNKLSETYDENNI